MGKYHLSPREQQVLMMMAEGYTRQEMADELGIGMNTIATYIKRVHMIMHSKNAAHAVALAYHYGILKPMRVG